MSILHSFQNALDGLIGLFSPRAGVIRKNYRKQQRGYDAAETYSSSGVWKNANKTTVNQEISASRDEVTARMRQLVRDFPPMKKATKATQDYTVGNGVKLQMTLKKPNGDLDTELNQKIEDDFNEWCEANNCDLAGKFSYSTMERMAVRQVFSEAGECLIVKHYPKNKGFFIPFQIQGMESDWLDTSQDTAFSRSSDQFRISQGIKYDVRTGRVISYLLRDSIDDSYFSSLKTTEIPASSVIHYMNPERFGQERGISPYTSGMQISDSFGNYFDAEVDRAQIAARQLGVVETDINGSSKIPGVTQNSEDEDQIEFEGTMIDYLNPGQKMNFNQTPNVGNNFEQFIKTLHRWLAVATDKPYHIISGDMSGNYTTLRMAVNDLVASVKSDYSEHVKQFSTPIVREFFRIGALSGLQSLSGFFADPRRFHKAATWQGPGRQELDPLKEAKAAVTELENGLRSHQEIIRARGGDPDKVFKELAEAKAVLEAAGFDTSLGGSSTASAGNPAAVVNQ